MADYHQRLEQGLQDALDVVRDTKPNHAAHAEAYDLPAVEPEQEGWWCSKCGGERDPESTKCDVCTPAVEPDDARDIPELRKLLHEPSVVEPEPCEWCDDTGPCHRHIEPEQPNIIESPDGTHTWYDFEAVEPEPFHVLEHGTTEKWPHTGPHVDCLRCKEDHFDALKRQAVEPEPVYVSPYCPACEIEIGGPCKDCCAPVVEPEQPTYRRSTAERAAAKGNAGAKALSDTTTNLADDEYIKGFHDGITTGVAAEQARIERIAKKVWDCDCGGHDFECGLCEFITAIRGGDDA